MPEKKAPKKNPPKKDPAEAAPTPAPKPVPEGSQVIELFVENIMKVRCAHIKPKNSVVQITGKNGQGKTSVLRAIAWALTGTSDIPSRPIRAGQKSGIIKMDLGDLVVTRYFTAIDPDKSDKGMAYTTRLLVEGKRREQFRTPQTVLDALIGKISFDPLAFTRMDGKKQLETLRGLVTFDIDIDQLDAEQKVDYDERRQAGREVDSRKARIAEMERPDPALPTELVDTAEITKRLEGAANHNSVVASQRQLQARKREQAQQEKDRVLSMMEDIRVLQEQIEGLRHSIEAATKTSCRLSDEADAMTIDAETDTATVAAELTQANAVNHRIGAAARFREVEEELREGMAYWMKLDTRIKERAEQRTAAIGRAKMPIAGLSIGDGEVLYQGLPFGQASNAEQIRVSMALAMASNPKLRVLRISDGSLLDSDSMGLITAEAEKHGFQVWIERVDSTGAVGVVMEDGNASGEEVVQPK
jgi:molybdopterin-guanine dinucleotide biosynthesis protein